MKYTFILFAVMLLPLTACRKEKPLECDHYYSNGLPNPPPVTTFKGFTANELDTVWLYTTDTYDTTTDTLLYRTGAVDSVYRIEADGAGSFFCRAGAMAGKEQLFFIPATGSSYHIYDVVHTLTYLSIDCDDGNSRHDNFSNLVSSYMQDSVLVIDKKDNVLLIR